jgi:hypothetical protein
MYSAVQRRYDAAAWPQTVQGCSARDMSSYRASLACASCVFSSILSRFIGDVSVLEGSSKEGDMQASSLPDSTGMALPETQRCNVDGVCPRGSVQVTFDKPYEPRVNGQLTTITTSSKRDIIAIGSDIAIGSGLDLSRHGIHGNSVSPFQVRGDDAACDRCK